MKAFEPYGNPEEMRRKPGDMHGILFQVIMILLMLIAHYEDHEGDDYAWNPFPGYNDPADPDC